MTESCKYFIPGPVWVRSEVMAEMTRPMIGHRGAEFRALMKQIYPDLRTLFGTKQHAFVAACSGTGLLEAAIVNCVPRSVLVTTCGAFSERWLKIASQMGLEADHLEFGWGEPVDPVRLANHLRGRHHHYDAVTITHNETSTGVINDVAILAAVVREHSADTLILVDAVSSLASAPVRFDEWGLDVCVASSQKGIGIPPGVAVMAVSERAMAASIKEKYKSLYFDFAAFRKSAEEESVPYTPSVPHIYALAKQLDYIIRGEGLEARWERHRRLRDLTIERTAAHAALLAPRDAASPSVSTLKPANGAPRQVLDAMKARGYTLSGGYGKLKDTTYRIGHMGDMSVGDVEEMLEVLGEIMK